MKTFEIVWYRGSIDEEDFLKQENVLKREIIKDDSIDKVLGCKILPDEILKKVLYTRTTLFSQKLRVIDYGSHSKFIAIHEIDGD